MDIGTRVQSALQGLTVRANQRLLEHQVRLGGQDLVLRAEGFRPHDDSADHDDGWLAALILESRSYLDVGCSVGLFAVIAALDPARRVVAIDANTRALQTCASNLIANGLSDRVSLIAGYASDTDGDGWRPTAADTDPGFPTHAHRPIQTYTLDRLCADLDVSPDLVKIDVEGHEAETLGGAVGLARGDRGVRPRFHVEVHRIAGLTMAENGERMLAWCRDHDYDAWYLAEHVKVDDVSRFAHRGRCHLLLLPSGQDEPASVAHLPQSTPISTVIPAG